MFRGMKRRVHPGLRQQCPQKQIGGVGDITDVRTVWRVDGEKGQADAAQAGSSLMSLHA